MSNFFEKHKDIALLIVRVGLGFTFIYIHGWPKISGGVERWALLAGAMKSLGITFAPEFWGFMASFAEFGGGIALLLGLLFRPFMVLLIINLFVAMMSGIGKQWLQVAYPLEVMLFMFLLLFVGPGKYSIDAWWSGRKKSKEISVLNKEQN